MDDDYVPTGSSDQEEESPDTTEDEVIESSSVSRTFPTTTVTIFSLQVRERGGCLGTQESNL